MKRKSTSSTSWVLAATIAFMSASTASAASAAASAVAPAPAAKVQANPLAPKEDYKSFNPDNRFTFGFSGGFGLVDTSGGAQLVGHIATKLVDDGFVPEIVNPVFLELQFGPLFTSGVTVWTYSTHLRWDFVKDEKWTLFAIGGLGGNWMSNKLGDRFAIHPRFGVGFFYMMEKLDLRFDFSHEAILAGVSFPF